MTSLRPEFSVLIIGCGAIAGGYDEQDIKGKNILTHAKAFERHEGFHLAGCVDLDPMIAQKFAKTWQVDRTYDTLADALNDQNFDIVSICTSTSSHEYYLRALQKYDAKIVFCEKPITDNMQSALEMAHHYKDNMAVNYLRRFDPKIRQLAQDIQDGHYGKFLSGEAKYNKGLYNNGSHMTDLLHMMVGNLWVKKAENIIYDFWPDDPTIGAKLETIEGKVIDLIGCDVRKGMVFNLCLTFERAEILLMDFSHTITIRFQDGSVKNINTDLDQGMLNVVSNIYDHLVLGTALFSTAENAVSALKICEDIRRLTNDKG
ncbi:MAG: Gfo/Idh/MocA family oxidoreductase [Emcibacter sp.]|nr:Gfo/Idh/MocA family oxidoreductase [Emcibacter sp.]